MMRPQLFSWLVPLFAVLIPAAVVALKMPWVADEWKLNYEYELDLPRQPFWNAPTRPNQAEFDQTYGGDQDYVARRSIAASPITVSRSWGDAAEFFVEYLSIAFWLCAPLYLLSKRRPFRICAFGAFGVIGGGFVWFGLWQ